MKKAILNTLICVFVLGMVSCGGSDVSTDRPGLPGAGQATHVPENPGQGGCR